MLQRLVAVFVLVGALISCGHKPSTEVSDLYESLGRVSARVETGISYNDMVEMLGDVNYKLKKAKESSSDTDSKIVNTLENAFVHYVNSAQVWKDKIDADYLYEGKLSDITTLAMFMGGKDKTLEALSEKYAWTDLSAPVSEGGAVEECMGGKHVCIDMDRILHYHWQAAGAAIESVRGQFI